MYTRYLKWLEIHRLDELQTHERSRKPDAFSMRLNGSKIKTRPGASRRSGVVVMPA